MVEEWSDKFNPYNSEKLLTQVYKWKEIKRGNLIPPPTLVSLDPANLCDLKCEWCNAHKILEENKRMLSQDTLYEIADFLKEWKTEAICIGGGGESLMNPYTGLFINKCVNNGVDVGVVTNGTQINHNLESLSKCTWVGVSIDAGTKSTYIALKGRDRFKQVIFNIKNLVEYSKEHNRNLTNKDKGIGVGMKYLLYKNNINEIFQASQYAKMMGCSNIHIRPSAPPWDKIGDTSYDFSERDLKRFRRELERARSLEDENFKVYGITHKFDGKFKVINDFNNCHAIFMTCVIMPPTSKEGKFNLGFCCDRRGDKNLVLEDLVSTQQIKDFWGSEEHWKMFDKIKPSLCGKCTYRPHQQIYENVILKNKMCYQFI